MPTSPAAHLATNLRSLRAAANLTQARLAERAGIPRSTLAHLETGEGNPTLQVLASLSEALRVTVEELISPPHAQSRVYRAHQLPIELRPGGARVHKLLPDPVPGMEIDRFELPPGARMAGVPHRPGTREYLFCEAGRLVLWAAGERSELHAGDVATFQGDRPHAYANEGAAPVVAFSVVAFAPRTGGEEARSRKG